MSSKLFSYGALGLCLLLGAACRPAADRPPADHILARAGDKTLLLSEVAGAMPRALPAPDSLAFLKRYADAWVRQQLMLRRAAAETPATAEIDRKVAAYREYLIGQAYEEQYVSRHADTVVSESEMTAYYRANTEDFTLQQPIMQASLVALPKNAPQLDRARRLMQSRQPRDRKELLSYCYRFARFYHLGDSTWRTFDELVRNTPFRETPDAARMLKNNSFAETSDEQTVYLLAVRAYRLPGQPAPLPFVRPQVREILYNRRRVKLIQELEAQLYAQARQRGEAEVRVP